MAAFSGTRLGFTPAVAGAPNWALDANAAGDMGKIVSIGWGGELTTSTAYRTRWARSNVAAAGAETAISEEDHNPGQSTPTCALNSTYATTEPALPTAPQALFGVSWNAHGGVGYVALPLASPWYVINGLANDIIMCGNDAGTDANGSSYTVTWEE